MSLQTASKFKAAVLLSATLVAMGLTPVRAFADPETAAPAATLEQVVCPAVGKDVVNVYWSKDDKPWFTAGGFETIKTFQGWGENEITRTIDGKPVKLIRVQFSNRGQVTDPPYVAETEITNMETCQTRHGLTPYTNSEPADNEHEGEGEGEADDESFPHTPTLTQMIAELKRGPGLDGQACCSFPLNSRGNSYMSGIARFGARRSKGRRVHAAADIYGTRGEAIKSVQEGVVVRGIYYFYQETYAIEVMHSGGFVARYGETSGKTFGVPTGTRVTKGQRIAEMGKTSCCTPMLHFELYSGTQSGRLSQGGNRYSRRTDIMNPTQHLNKWKQK